MFLRNWIRAKTNQAHFEIFICNNFNSCYRKWEIFQRVLNYSGCHNKIMQVGCLEKKEFTSLTSSEVEIWDQRTNTAWLWWEISSWPIAACLPVCPYLGFHERERALLFHYFCKAKNPIGLIPHLYVYFYLK